MIIRLRCYVLLKRIKFLSPLNYHKLNLSSSPELNIISAQLLPARDISFFGKSIFEMIMPGQIPVAAAELKKTAGQ